MEMNTKFMNDKNKSFAMSYAKDILCAGKITLEQLEVTADKILAWLNK